jgi:hypothetical protein
MNLADAASHLPDGIDAGAIAAVWTDSPTEAAIHVFDSAERNVVVEVLAFDLPHPMTKLEFEAQDWASAILTAREQSGSASAASLFPVPSPRDCG